MVQHIWSGPSVETALVNSPHPWLWSLSHRLLSTCFYPTQVAELVPFPCSFVLCPHSPQLLLSNVLCSITTATQTLPPLLQPLEWAVGNSQWHPVQLLDGGGGGGECFESCISQNAFGGRNKTLTQAGLNNREFIISHIRNSRGQGGSKAG